eukprot:m.791027 g.791027  ORF g.791027 m.791027 type:complete len:66 (-) comp23329_c0_seq7:364-561(-)
MSEQVQWVMLHLSLPHVSLMTTELPIKASLHLCTDGLIKRMCCISKHGHLKHQNLTSAAGFVADA